MSDSAFHEDYTSSQSDMMSGNTISSEMPVQPILFPSLQDTTPPQIIICRLCSEIFLEPVIFSCGHTFCLSCSEKWREKRWLCPQAGCEKPLGKHVPNLIVNEASTAHRAMKMFVQQQLQQLQSINLPLQCAPSPEDDEENQPFEQWDHWSGAREVGIRKSSRRITTPNKRDLNKGSGSSFERTYTGANEMKMPSIEEVSIHGSPCPSMGKNEGEISIPNDRHEEKSSSPVAISRFIPHKRSPFIRGVHGRRSETYQVQGKTTRQSFCRRSLKHVFNRQKDHVSEKLPQDISLGDHPDLSSNVVWSGQQFDKDDQTYPTHSMKFKKEKSLWKRLFSSNNKSSKN